MTVAALYDIHANLPALEAVLEEVATLEVDRIVVGGDVVPGPMPHGTIDRLLALDVPVEFLHGNGESAVLAHLRGEESTHLPEAARAGIEWTAAELRAADRRLLAGWPATVRMSVEGLGEVLFCHATPRSDTEIFTRRTAEELLVPIFAEADAAVVVCGHTHMQFDRRIGTMRVLNAGSVGMPFGEPGARWLSLGPEVELRRTGYDLAEAAQSIRATRYPGAADFARRGLLDPPSEEEMLELYAGVELQA